MFVFLITFVCVRLRPACPLLVPFVLRPFGLGAVVGSWVSQGVAAVFALRSMLPLASLIFLLLSPAVHACHSVLTSVRLAVSVSLPVHFPVSLSSQSACPSPCQSVSRSASASPCQSVFRSAGPSIFSSVGPSSCCVCLSCCACFCFRPCCACFCFHPCCACFCFRPCCACFCFPPCCACLSVSQCARLSCSLDVCPSACRFFFLSACPSLCPSCCVSPFPCPSHCRAVSESCFLVGFPCAQSVHLILCLSASCVWLKNWLNQCSTKLGIVSHVVVVIVT